MLAEARAADLSFNEAVRRGVFTVPGDGDLDLGAAVGFARRGGYRGWLVVVAEQPPAPVPPSAHVSAAYHHLKGQFEAVIR